MIVVLCVSFLSILIGFYLVVKDFLLLLKYSDWLIMHGHDPLPRVLPHNKLLKLPLERQLRILPII